jgi:hypothetical protein
MPVDLSWWLRIFTILAAMVGVVGNWNPSSSAEVGSNLILASSFGWLLIACYGVIEGYKSKAARFDHEEEGRFLLKESILEASSEKKEARDSSRIRASQILIHGLREMGGAIIEPQVKRTTLTETALSRLASSRQSVITRFIHKRESHQTDQTQLEMDDSSAA